MPYWYAISLIQLNYILYKLLNCNVDLCNVLTILFYINYFVKFTSSGINN